MRVIYRLEGPEQIIIDDMIVLGKGSPDRMKDRRLSICTGGYSHKLGFIRLYPTKRDSPLKRWSIIQVPVERNPRDTRPESWKIQGSKREWSRLSEKIEVKGELKRRDRLNLIGNLVDNCTETIKEEGRSLGIIKPEIKKTFFVERDKYDPEIQTTLLDGYGVMVKANYPYQPRIEYTCSDCRIKGEQHNKQIIEWGIYEWMRKNPDKLDQVWQNLRKDSPEHEIYFFVGNMLYRQNRFLIISWLPLPRGPITELLTPLRKVDRLDLRARAVIKQFTMCATPTYDKHPARVPNVLDRIPS